MATPARPHRVTLTLIAVGAVFWTSWFSWGAYLHQPRWWMIPTTLLVVAQMVWLLRLKK